MAEGMLLPENFLSLSDNIDTLQYMDINNQTPTSLFAANNIFRGFFLHEVSSEKSERA